MATFTVMASSKKEWKLYGISGELIAVFPNWASGRDAAVEAALAMTPTARVELYRLDGTVKRNFLPRPAASNTADLVNAVKDFALANYDNDGWDFIVECYSDEELAELVSGARNEKAAIAKCLKVVTAQNDYRSEIQATAF